MAMDWSSFGSEIDTGLLQELGSTITVNVPSGSTVSATGKKTKVTYTSYTGRAVKGKYDDSFVTDGSVIQAGDVKFICRFDDDSFAPVKDKNETVTFGNVNYKVVNVNPVEPAGDSVVVYIIQARRVN